MKRSLRVTFATLLFSVAIVAQQPTIGQDSETLPVIDVHTHTSFSDKPGSRRTQAAYFEEWKSAGVVGAVAHTSANGGGFNPLKDKNVIYCAGIGEQTNIRTIESGLRAGKFGCLKIYLGYVHRYAYDRRYEPYYRLALKYDVPVVFHTGDTNSTVAKLKYTDPLTIDEVAVDHPKVRFVIAHCGNPWIQSAAEVAYKNPNVFLECSALLIGNIEEMPGEKVEEYVVKPIAWIFGYVENPSKLMFGTDWPLTGIKPYLDAYKRAIPREHWKAVFHDNAVRVFKFPSKP